MTAKLDTQEWVFRELHATPAATAYENQRVLGEMLIVLKSKERTFASLPEFRTFVVSRGVRLTRMDPKRSFETSPVPGEYFTRPDGRWYDDNQ